MAKQSQVKARRKLINPVFHFQTKQEDDGQLTTGMIKVVRKTGQLNLSGRGLASVPKGMFKMYETGGSESVKHFDMSKGTDDPWWTFQPLTYMDISSNVLVDIPPEIKMFEDMTVLNLQDNCLSNLPSEIGALTKLTRLNLSHNKIESLPMDFYRLTELQQLNLSHNSLSAADVGFVDLVMLQTLDLAHNQLTQLPSGIGYLVRLTDLNLAHNQLTELPTDLSNIRALLKLDVTHNNLRRLPNLGELRKLQVLYAQHNDIEELPGFEGCENLQELYFGNNFIKDVEADFCESMSLLKILDLRDNKIEILPDQIAMLQHIIRMDLTNNELASLPNSLGLLSHLQNLQIEGNKFKQIRQDLIKGGTLRLLKHLRDKMIADEKKLNVNGTNAINQEVRVFPDKYMMKNSRALNLTQKELTQVPENVFEDAAAAEVHIVDISKNKLTEVPNGLSCLSGEISELNMSINRIKELPEFVGSFSRLQYLDLGKNNFSDLPSTLGQLRYLRELVLSYNFFTAIPSCVYELETLEILLVSDNQIAKIDAAGLKRLKRLATLDFSNNNIDSVPFELGNVKQLRCLELKGNSFKLPRYAILEQGTESVLSYLRDRIPT